MSASESARQLVRESDEEDRTDCREWMSRFDAVRSMAFWQAGEQRLAIGYEAAWEPAIVSSTWARVER